MSGELPDLRRREEVQAYLRDLSSEISLQLCDPQFAAALDSRDQLRRFREEFHVPKIGELLEGRAKAEDVDLSADCVYMVGNSLGLKPKKAKELMCIEMDKWAQKAIYKKMKLN